MSRIDCTRRYFLATTCRAAAVGLGGAAQNLLAGELPPASNPRATDGDQRHEPVWEKSLTITVGPKQADLVGEGDRVIQAAVDYMARMGGGTVQLMPGTFTLRNAVVLASRVRLLGSGTDTIITRVPSVTTTLAADSDWYDQEVTVSDARGLRVGDGVVFRAKNPHDGSQIVIKRTLIARAGNRFKLNDGLRKNLWLSGEPTCSSLFPLLTGENSADVTIENLTLDGNRAHCDNLDGNHAGCIFLQDCNRYRMRNVEARNFNGDGISFQVCHDVIVEDCYSHDHAGLGLHPGSGAQRPIMRNNRLERNDIGLFWCWGVKFGLAEDNHMDANRRYGISIGHNDTDNVMRGNTVINSGRIGILFRDDSRGSDFWANRNRVEKNRIVNSGGEDGVGIDVQGNTKDVAIIGNVLKEMRPASKRIGIRISAQARRIDLAENRIEGFAQAVQDERNV